MTLRRNGREMGYQLGIDLGSTHTAAAVCRAPDQRGAEPEVVTLGARSATVPSVLFVAPDGAVLVGDAAERRALTDPDRVAREFKRRIGDPTPVVVGGRRWAPEALSAQLVRWVVDRVAEREGGSASGIAVTHPASWGAHKKDLLGAALSDQGLAVTFLAEPQAAAVHYAAAERVPVGSTVAVYDLGGGTFDAAVVRKVGAEGFELLGRPEGLDRLGGIDFDDLVFEHVRDGRPDAFADLDDTDPAVLSAMSRIRRECTEAKEALSSDTEVSIPVLLPASRGSVRLHRSEFEAMVRSRLEETVDALRGAISSAGIEPGSLSAVLLVGGSSRIPLVAQLISAQLGRPVAVDTDPKNAIAQGAALALSPPVPRATAGLPHEPATELFSAGLGADPPTRPAVRAAVPAPTSAAPDAVPGRPVGLLMAIGGLTAAVVVVSAVAVAAMVGRSAPDIGIDPTADRDANSTVTPGPPTGAVIAGDPDAGTDPGFPAEASGTGRPAPGPGQAPGSSGTANPSADPDQDPAVPAQNAPAPNLPAAQNLPAPNPAVSNPAVPNPAVSNPAVPNPPVDDPPADDPPVEEPPVDEPPVDEPPVENPPPPSDGGIEPPA